jgi:hypothetical protein
MNSKLQFFAVFSGPPDHETEFKYFDRFESKCEREREWQRIPNISTQLRIKGLGHMMNLFVAFKIKSALSALCANSFH